MPHGLEGDNRGEDGWRQTSGSNDPISLPNPPRLREPQLRGDRPGRFSTVTWNAVIDQTASEIAAIITKHGADSVAFWSGDHLDTEAAYAAVKLFKGAIGTNNINTCSRFAVSGAAAALGYRTSLGADGPPPCLADIDQTDCLVIWGGDVATTHPEALSRIKSDKCVIVGSCNAAPRSPGVLHLPVARGGEIALFNAVALLLLEMDAINHRFIARHTTGYDAFFHLVTDEEYLDLVDASGVPEPLVREFARRIGSAQSWLSLHGAGRSESRSEVAQHNSMINLHLLTGQIGKPGAGPLALSGPGNLMGMREAGLSPRHLPGQRFIDDPTHRTHVESYWNRPAGAISRQPGPTFEEMLDALEAGRIKAVWIAGVDPNDDWLNQPRVHKALTKAELVIMQGTSFPSAITHSGHVILPTSQGLEKTGTITSPDRLVRCQQRTVPAPGAALPDWQIIVTIAQALGYSGFAFNKASEVWDEFIPLTVGRPCDMRGLTSSRLTSAGAGPAHWPCPTLDHDGTERLYLDQVFPTPDGLARFLMRPHLQPFETPDHDFSIVLSSGRTIPARPVGPRSQRLDQGRTRMLRNATGP